MPRLSPSLVLALAALSPVFSYGQKPSPFVGRWDFNLSVPDAPSRGAAWLGITEKNGALDVWYQPTGGNVYQLKDVKADGSHLTLMLSAGGKNGATTWELEAAGNALNGTQKRGANSVPLHGVRAPELKRNPPKAWSAPEPLFNGKDLTGWEPVGNIANNHWRVADGLLVNEDKGANLKTTSTYNDFKVHFEVNCPDKANSGFYLRGRYEVQLEYEAPGTDPPERSMGSIYGRIAPSPELPRTPGQWESFDIMLVGRIVTISRNGTMTTDHKEIDGITGGALDANEGDPGPFYIQGDHTGGLKFRNITVSVPRK
jgi:hypothetical protein